MKNLILMLKNNLRIRSILAAFASCLLCSAQGQSNALVIATNINLPKDLNIRNQVIDSLNGFLAQKEKHAAENSFVRAGDRLQTSLLLDELKGIESSARDKADGFYRPCLLNCAPIDETNFLVQFSYLGRRDDVCITRVSFRLLAAHEGNQFYFSPPLGQNTVTWKHKNFGHCQFHFKQTLDTAKAAEYAKLVASFDEKLKASGQLTEVYCCDGLPEALQLFGVDYKSDYNGFGASSFSTHEGHNTLVVNGDSTGVFTNFDAHDLWHSRLHNVLSTKIINRPVDEGCAYLYGGSWGYSWPEILGRFKDKLAANPKADWLDLYQSLQNFGDSQDKHLIATYVIDALLVQKIEKEKGFGKVMELLSCGKYEKGNENFFAALEKIAGINKTNFNAEVWKLVKAS